MTPERYSSRRRFLGLLVLGVAALAGCTDDEDGNADGDGESDDGDGGESDEPPEETGEGEEAEADEAGSESGEEHGEPGEGGDDPPNVEGTNLFVRVIDGEGAAIEGATVRITGGAFDGEEFETDADGRVIRQNVEPGEYTVTAAVGDREDERESAIEEGDDETLTFTFSDSSEDEEGEGGEQDDGGDADR